MTRIIVGCLFLLFLCSHAAGKDSTWIEPGAAITLEADEGLLVFVIDSDSNVQSVRLDRIGSLFTSPKMKELAAGRYLRLLKLPAGEYRVQQLTGYFLELFPIVFEVGDIPNARFRVEAGKINYAGDLISRGELARAFRIANRSLSAWVTLEQEYPGLTGQFPWRHAMAEPDTFIDFWRQAQAEAEAADVTAVSPPWAQGLKPDKALIDSAKQLFQLRPDSIAMLSPDGEAAIELIDNEQQRKLWIHHLPSAQNSHIKMPAGELGSLIWLSERRFAMNLIGDGLAQGYLVDIDAQGRVQEPKAMPAQGMLLSVLPDQSGVGYFADYRSGQVRLYTVNTRLPAADWVKRALDQHWKRVRGDYFWWVDQHGLPRVAARRDKQGEHYLFVQADGSTKTFRPVLKVNEVLSFVGFTRDGRFVASTNIGRTQLELVEFDLEANALGKTVFAVPDADVVAAPTLNNGLVESAYYLSEGRLRQHSLDGRADTVLKTLQEQMPKRSLVVMPPASNGDRIVLVEAGDQPVTLKLFEAKTQSVRDLKLAYDMPELGPLYPTERFEVRVADGRMIEAFLTRPGSRLPAPLAVMPHGGPLGAYDADTFDPEVQYLARSGYAVLRVNFRGSGNRSLTRLDEGFGEVGRGIEDDINLAVDHAIQTGGIDANRIIALGTSYGGYSAMMLGIRWPQRYRASVAIAAALDLCLFLSDADFVASQAAIDHWRRLIGMTASDPHACQRISPVYRYREVTQPVLLVHDFGDERVTYQHVQRFVRMMALAGIKAPVLTLKSNVHGIQKSTDQIEAWPIIVAFLNQVLAGTPAAATPPANALEQP